MHTYKCHKCNGTGKIFEEIFDEDFEDYEDPLDEEDYIPEGLQKEAQVQCYLCNGTGYLTAEDKEKYDKFMSLEGRIRDWYLKSEEGKEDE